MHRLILALILMAVPAGAWRQLPPPPTNADAGRVAVWTGRELLVFGRAHVTELKSVNVAAAYDPSTDTWRKLAPPPGLPGSYEGRYSAVWTGKALLLTGPLLNEAFNPATNRWRALPSAPTGAAGALVVWTRRELIGWGGGCCGDASADGIAYNPATNKWRKLPRAPLAPAQGPSGAWTGRELIIFGVRRPDGPALTTVAGYDPKTDHWRRLASLPAPRYGATAVWDGKELLAIGGSAVTPAPAKSDLAYNPATNHWRKIQRMPGGRSGAAAVWTGSRVLVWGGRPAGPGLAYDSKSNRWSKLPRAPLAGPEAPAVWTGQSMLVWNGSAAAAYTP